MKRFSFGKKERLSRQKDIQHVFSAGISFRGSKLRIFFAPNQEGVRRCCTIVPLKTTSRSIILRNRVRRLLKEIFRLNKEYLRDNIDIIILFSPNRLLTKAEVKTLKIGDLQEEFLRVCNQAGFKND